MKKEIYLGYGLYKYIEVKEEIPEGEVEWRIVETEEGGFIRRPFKIQTESLRMQDELEPIFHPTQHDESDDIEESKKEEGELTEFEKAEFKRKVKNRSVWGDKEWHFFKGEKWEHKYDT